MALDPNTALTTVADVAAELGQDPNALTQAQVALYERKIAAASKAVETYLGRGPLGFEDAITEAIRGYGSIRIHVSKTPILAVTTLTINGRTLTTDDYIIEAKGQTGLIYLKSEWCWPYTGAGTWEISHDRFVDTEAEDPRQIQITYSGGWVLPGQTSTPQGAEALPADIGEAVSSAVAQQIQTTGRDRSITSERLMSEATTYAYGAAGPGGVPGWPEDLSDILRPYRRTAQF